MKVSYKGMTGELVKLERAEKQAIFAYCVTDTSSRVDHGPDCYLYSLEIWEKERGCKISFPGVSLKDVKFLGGEVTYG